MPIFVLVPLLASSVIGSPLSTERTVVVDHAHCQLSQEGGKEAPKYRLGPTAEIAIDTRKFDFAKSLYPQAQPNCIQLLIANDRQYSAAYTFG